MSEPTRPVVTHNPWDALRRFTPARIALGRSGISQPTAPQLAFQLAHAQARDAVHHPFDVAGVAAAIHGLGLQTVTLQSAAADRATYLQRPDLGRRLDEASAIALDAISRGTSARADVAIVVADGLSSLAVERHAAPFLAQLLPRLRAGTDAWSIATVALVREARVAIGDDIGARLHADLVLVLIGERPGLSSPDSMGLYLTWSPRPGRTDAERNCISNVRPEGLPYTLAAARAAHLLHAARTRRVSGVTLKDDSAPEPAALEAIPTP